jgi:hypothetical protein
MSKSPGHHHSPHNEEEKRQVASASPRYDSLHMQQIVQQELLLQQTMTQTYCEQEVEVEILEFQKHSQ